jgi:hypothetical protein
VCGASDLIGVWQQLGQNLVAYERSYRTMLGLADRLDAVLSRIECLEGAVGGTIAEMQVLADELVCAEPLIARRRPKKRRCEEAEEQQHPVPSILQQVKKNITARMTEIERRMSSEIHDCMEPSAAFIQRKRRQRESDAFLNVIALFDDDL